MGESPSFGCVRLKLRYEQVSERYSDTNLAGYKKSPDLPPEAGPPARAANSAVTSLRYCELNHKRFLKNLRGGRGEDPGALRTGRKPGILKTRGPEDGAKTRGQTEPSTRRSGPSGFSTGSRALGRFRQSPDRKSTR